MYSHLIDTFITVAEEHSFSRAAEKHFISTTAVIKQMNQLEGETGLTLFRRSRRGVSLTDSGRSLYEDAKLIVRLSRDAIERARRIEQPPEPYIRVGTSVMRSGDRLLELWSRINAAYSDLKIHIVPFEDRYTNYLDIVKKLGQEIDVIAGIYPSGLWGNSCNVLKLADMRICCAVPGRHPLAGRERLTLRDMYGEKLMIVEQGSSSFMDAARREVQKHPEIEIIDTHYYDIGIFNQCETTGALMLTAENWANVHPMLVTIPIDWDLRVPYGLVYSKAPNATVRRFIEIIEKEGVKATELENQNERRTDMGVGEGGKRI